jgi:chemotaxis protein histidine kinase CheA
MSVESPAELIPQLATLRWRLRLRDGWHLLQRAAWLVGLGMVAFMLLGRVLPIDQLRFWTWAGFPLLGLGTILIYSIFHRMSLNRVAQRVDLELGLKERLSTAFELETQLSQPDQNQPSDLPTYQHSDALATAHAIDPRWAFPLTWLRRPTLVAAGMLVAVLVLTYLPNPMDVVLAERAAVAKAAQEQAEKVEQLKQEIEQSTTLTPELQAELLHQLAELAQQLRDNPGDREKALADLSKLEENLRRRLDPNADQMQAALDAISAQLQSLAQMENSNSTNPELTAAALEKLAKELADMSASEQADLAEALAQLAAQAAQSGDASLSQALAAMSQAAQAGDSQAAAQSSAEAAEALVQVRQNLSNQNALQQALGQLQNASQSLAQAGQQAAGQQPGNQPGNNPGAGQNPGQGQGGQGMSGGGTKADVLPPATGSGQARRPGDQDTGSTVGDPAEQVFIPWERRTTEGAEVTIPGQDTGQGETITRENPNPSGGLPGSALIPYQQVYAQYQQAAQQAVNRADIPPAYRDLVRDYFTLLEP